MRRPKIPLLLSIALATVLIVWSSSMGCSSVGSRLAEKEKALGTEGIDNWFFHRIPEDLFGVGLRFPGYVVAFEKTSRKEKLALEPFADDPKSWQLEYPDRLRPKERKKISGWLEDGRQAFLSHLVRYSYEKDEKDEKDQNDQTDFRYRSIWPKMLYNAYEDLDCRPERPCPKIYSRGIEALEKPLPHDDGLTLAQQIRQDVDDLKITHLIVYCMGWNTDQQEALRNYNSLMGHLADVAGSGFRPLVIAITWDSQALSSWLRIFTYPFKANDADEIGAVWVNRLLRKVLIPIREERRDLRLVLIGHSFGARVLTQAVFSYPLLGIRDCDEPPDTRDDCRDSKAAPSGSDNRGESCEDGIHEDQIDLIIALQGAVSVNRFIDVEGVGNECAPYRAFERAGDKFALTWSKHDTANPKALWFSHAKLAGGKPGFERARRFSAQGKDGEKEVFELATWCPESWPTKAVVPSECQDRAGAWAKGAAPTPRRDRVTMIDVSSIVRYGTHLKGGGAHSDIYTKDMAKVLWRLIQLAE